MWRLLVCKLAFVICTDLSSIAYLKHLLFDLAYGKKGKKSYIKYRLQRPFFARAGLRHAFDEVKQNSRCFRFYKTLYDILLLSALPSYAALCTAHVNWGGCFSWVDVTLGIGKSLIWLFLRLHFDASHVSIFTQKSRNSFEN